MNQPGVLYKLYVDTGEIKGAELASPFAELLAHDLAERLSEKQCPDPSFWPGLERAELDASTCHDMNSEVLVEGSVIRVSPVHAKVRRLPPTVSRKTVEPRGERVFALAFGAAPVGLRRCSSAVIDEFGVRATSDIAKVCLRA